MNHYTFDEIEIGTRASFEKILTDNYMQLFKELSGDENPMHTDTEYAKSRGYLDRIVYGMLLSSFYSTLVGMYLPGEKCLLNKCEIDYKKPVYVGDTLTITGEVIDKRVSTHRIMIKGKIINQKGITVNTSKITVSFTGDY
ncbi:MAG: MaoC family dehydratase [bacterium]